MVGVHGSLITSLTAAALVGEVMFGRRPTQLTALPGISLFSEGTRDIEYQFPGSPTDDDDKTKTKTYRVRVEVFHETLAGAEVLGEAVEKVLEAKATQDAVCSVSGADHDGVSVYDEGGEKYEPYPQFSGVDPAAPLIPHRGVLNYAVTIRRNLKG